MRPPAHRAYPFRRRSRRVFAGAVDAVGYRFGRWLPHARRAGTVQRLLVVRLDHLGDGIFAGPALRALREGLPGVEITLLGGPWARDLYSGTGLVDRIVAVEVPWFARGPGAPQATWGRLARWVTSNDFDVAIDLRGDVRHLAWFALAGVPIRLGYGRTGGGFWLTSEPPFRAVHEVERNLDLVRQLVPEAQAGSLVPVPIAADDVTAAHAVLAEAGCDPQAPYVVCHPGAGYASKRWEPESLAAALDRIAGLGLGRIVLVGTAADSEMVNAVFRRTQTAPAVAVGRTTLRPLAALVAGAQLFLGHDSGPSHLAVAMGTPCVLLYSGVNDPAEWGPWRGKVRLLHTPVECSPCGLRDCNRQHECMRGYVPEDVATAARALMAPGGAPL